MKFWFGKKREDNTEWDATHAVQESPRATSALSTTPDAVRTEEPAIAISPTFSLPQSPSENAKVEQPTAIEMRNPAPTVATPDSLPVEQQAVAPDKQAQAKSAAAPIIKLKAIGTPSTSGHAIGITQPPSVAFTEASAPVVTPPDQQPATTPASYGFKAREIPSPPIVHPPTAPAGPDLTAQDDVRTVLRPKNNQKMIYDQFLNGLYDLVIIVDRHGHIVECNRRAETMLGYANRTDTWDMPISAIISGMTPPLFEQLKQSLASNDYAMINSRCLRKDGVTFPCEIGVSKTTFAGNNIVFSIRNSERHHAQEIEARQNKQALELCLSPTFICTPQDGTFVSVNQSFLDAFGIPTRQAALDITLFDLMPNLKELFNKAIAGAHVHEQITISAAAGQNIKVEVVLAPAFAANKTIHTVIGSMMQV